MQCMLNVKREYTADVAVIGGGTAGVFAAIAAANTGADTLLIEKDGRLGGTITTAGVDFPGLFHAWGKKIIDGPCWTSLEKASALGGAQIPEITYKPKDHWREQVRINIPVYTAVLHEMCKTAGVRVLTNAMLADAKETENAAELFIAEKTGLAKITAKVAIDATGDANLTQQMGYAVQKSQKQQPATLHNHLTGYDMKNVDMAELEEKFQKASFRQDITMQDMLRYLYGEKINNHIPSIDADTSEGRTVLEETALAYMMELYTFWRTVTGLQNITIDVLSEETGVRETNRIVGEKTVTAEDYVSGTFYPDSVCYAFYPIDLHVAVGIEQTFLKDGVVPKIPYGALIPKGAKRLLCAGRCVSSDTYANSALRVQAPCMAMGQAAGCAAALAAKNNTGVQAVSYEALCSSLKAIGAIVPREKEEM